MVLSSSYYKTLSRYLFAFLHSPKNEFWPLGRKRLCGFPPCKYDDYTDSSTASHLFPVGAREGAHRRPFLGKRLVSVAMELYQHTGPLTVKPLTPTSAPCLDQWCQILASTHVWLNHI